ncbi:hypothetical protein COLO4_34326 [Corchorus olitorius]|uniref:Retrotransposon gag protein n=1 Tax=Corchorus olitorius TaxID=93759 RepID=A0A1R3GM00_9ROSI|nr:hypothetical protein COLO4_34326 [Corchorus olitorius]
MASLQSSVNTLFADFRKVLELSLKRSDLPSGSHSDTGSPSRAKSPHSMQEISAEEDQHYTRSFTKHAKLDCPHFDGSDFFGWHGKIQQFFEADNTPEKSKIRTVQVHNPRTLAQAVNYARHIEFLLTTTDDLGSPFMPITATPITHIPYKPPPKLPPLVTKSPTTPMLTYSKQSGHNNRTDPNSVSTPKVPTREERDTRRKQGLCMWCATKYTPGHKCGVKAQFYQLLLEETVEPMAESEEFADCVNFTDEAAPPVPVAELDKNPIITLHALLGAVGPQTMRIAGTYFRGSAAYD